jgi:iron(III) transport system permease protein
VSAGLRAIDPAVEEASRVFAGGPLRTLLRVTLPAIRPALAAAILLGIITGISQFSVPLVLGAGARIDLLSVFIYRLLSTYPPQTAACLLLAVGMVAVVQGLLLVQRWVTPPERNAAIGGRGFRAARIVLGPWRMPIKGAVVLYLILTAVLPVAGLVLVSLQPFWTPIINWAQLSGQNFVEVVFDNRLTSASLTNSLMLGVATATISLLMAGLIILYFHQNRGGGRRVADSVMTLPATIPHTVIGVAFLLAFSIAPFKLYGTTLLLLLAYICLALPYAARAASSAASSISQELGEASRVFGASEHGTFRKILLPLALPGLIAGWIIVFVHTVGEVTASALLAGTGNPAIGRVLMELWTFASFPQVAALALVMTAISATCVGIMLIVSRRSVTARIS